MAESDNTPTTLAQFITIIEDKINTFRISPKLPTDLEEIIGAELDERYTWDSQRTSQAAISILKYTFFIKEKLSTNNCKLKFLNHHLSAIHGKYIMQTGVIDNDGKNFTPYLLREKILKVENERCGYLCKKILEIECENEELTSYSAFLQDFYYSLNSLSKTKSSDERTR